MAKKDNHPFDEDSPSPCRLPYRQRDSLQREARARYHTPSASPSSNSSNGKLYSDKKRDRSRSPSRELFERKEYFERVRGRSQPRELFRSKDHFERDRRYQHENDKRHTRVNQPSDESGLESESLGESHERSASLPPLCEHDGVVIKGAAKQKVLNDGNDSTHDQSYRVRFDDDCAYQLKLLWEMELTEEDYPRQPLHIAEDLKLELQRDLFWEISYGDPNEGRPREVGWIALLRVTMMTLV